MRLLATLCVSLVVSAAAAAQQAVASHSTATSVRPALREAGRVNGTPIMSDRVDAALDALIPLASFHRNVDPARLASLRRQAVQNVIDEELRHQEGVRLGLQVSDAEVNAGLARAQSSYASPAAFEQARRKAGVPLEGFRREIRRALMIAKAYDRAVASRCQVGPDEAARFFADNPARFVEPEQLHLYAITIGVDPSSPARRWAEAKAQADDLRRRLRAGEPFDALARRYSTDNSRQTGGDMGFVHRGSLSSEFEQALRDLKPGDITGVVQTLYGCHIVRLAEIRPSAKKAFVDVRDTLQKDLSKKRCAETADAWIARLRAGATIVVTDTGVGGVTPAAAKHTGTR